MQILKIDFFFRHFRKIKDKMRPEATDSAVCEQMPAGLQGRQGKLAAFRAIIIARKAKPRPEQYVRTGFRPLGRRKD